MHAVLRKFAPLFTLLLSSAVAFGQVATGTYPYGTFDAKGFDTINVGNLNVHFALPVLQKTGRGIPFSYNLSYDSSVWYPATVGGVTSWVQTQNFGWAGSTQSSTGYLSNTALTSKVSFNTGRVTITITCTDYTSWIYHDALGVSHPFPSEVSTMYCTPPGTSNPTSTGTAADGSGYTLSLSNETTGTITSPSGQQFVVPDAPSGATSASISDSNGNYISTDGNGNFTDTTGQIVLTVAGAAPSPQTLTYKDTNGNPQSVTVTYKTYAIQTAFGCSGIEEYGPQVASLVDAVTYPDGSSYHFSYEETPGVSANVTGRLAGVELPQGDWIQYSYSGGSNGIVCADGSTTGLTRILNSDSGSAASTWSYSRTAPNGTNTSHTDVVDGLGNHLAYNFVAPNNLAAGSVGALYYEANRKVYQGAESGTPVLARQTCYNGTAFPCTAATLALPISQIAAVETLDGLQTHEVTSSFNSSGLQTYQTIYDFGGPSSRGALLRSEYWAYSNDLSAFPGMLTSDEVYDGNSNLVGETSYSYDGASTAPSSGVPHHLTPTCPCGNLTSETVYANSGTSYQISATYEDTGSLLTSTTPNGTTTLTYDPTFVYNTATNLPTPSSGVALGYGSTFDTTNTGVSLTSTDPNTQTTRMPSYDSMLRPTEIQYPDGGETTLSYTPTQRSQHVYQSSSVYADTEIQYDGYGRLSRTAVANGQSSNPWYQADTCYDANGNVAFSAYQYQGTGFAAGKVCSGSGDSYTYDALGRLKTVTRANGETISYIYLGRATQAVDENGVTRISQIDGLGRTTIVCEISSNASMPGSGSPVSCGTDIAGTGFTTTYSYSLATGTTTITQGAQTRIFQTDWLGRTTSVTEPESGTTTYGYVYNATGLVVTRQRPKANQSNASTLTTTTTQYDSLGRVVTISYDDGTPTKSFLYDTNASWAESQSNLKGRLSKAFAATTLNGAGTIYSYDAMGRTALMAECLPSGCGTSAYDRTLTYTYDWAGNLLKSADGGRIHSTYAVSPAGEVLSLTSDLSNGTNPPNLLSNVLNGPNGPISFTLANGLSGVYSYDTLGRVSGGWVCSGGSTSSNCSGGTQVYGFTVGMRGVQVTGSADSVLNQGSTYGYDEFNRLTSRTVASNSAQNYTYVYDRYGNRWQQNGGFAPQLSFSATTNQISSGGYSYDAAGNLTNDGFHTYTYDAEGNITQVDGGTTAQYVYNALNQRVRTVVGSTSREFVFNTFGQRVSVWNGATQLQEVEGQYYWGGKPLAYYNSGGTLHFQHQDWLGTERMRTSYNGAVEDVYSSLPFGDAQTTGADKDQYHFAELDYDSETTTDHAQFRQYNTTQGRWLRPDPYYGSYDSSNPQTFNRYSYVSNNPLAYTDSSGLTAPRNWGFLSDAWFISADEVYGGGGLGGCTLDSLDTPCSGITDLLQGSAVSASYTVDNKTYYWNVDTSGSGWATGAGTVLTFDAAMETGLPALSSMSFLFAYTNGSTFDPLIFEIAANAPSNKQGCSVLDPNCKTPGPVANYLGFLGCEFNSTVEQLTDEEDAQSPVAVTISAIAAYGKKFAPWVRVTGAVTLSSFMIKTAVTANQECTPQFY